MTLQRHKPLPSLSALDTDGKQHDLNAEHRGRNLVIYVMPPNDHTSVVEAESFDARYEELRDEDTDIVGISHRGPADEKRMVKQYELHHPLLTDDDMRITKALDAWDENDNRVIPTAVLVDRNGRIEEVYHERDPARISSVVDRIVMHVKDMEDRRGTPARSGRTMPKEGEKAPVFNEKDQNSNYWTLGDFDGHWLVMYFYREDEVDASTKEAIGFKDARDRYVDADIKVVGVSPDRPSTHSRFVERHELPFTLIGDHAHQMADDYGVWNDQTGISPTTFVIDPSGTIRKVYRDVDPVNHAEKVLLDVKHLIDNEPKKSKK